MLERKCNGSVLVGIVHVRVDVDLPVEFSVAKQMIGQIGRWARAAIVLNSARQCGKFLTGDSQAEKSARRNTRK